jgi:hypothetical protein
VFADDEEEDALQMKRFTEEQWRVFLGRRKKKEIRDGVIGHWSFGGT